MGIGHRFVRLWVRGLNGTCCSVGVLLRTKCRSEIGGMWARGVCGCSPVRSGRLQAATQARAVTRVMVVRRLFFFSALRMLVAAALTGARPTL